jgi:branched-chain amino acid transport system permease protein
MSLQTATVLRSNTFRSSLLFSAAFIALLVLVNFALFNPGQVSVVVLSGLYQGMLFFLVSAGFSIVFGLLDVLNLAQGSFFMLGAYIGFAVYGSFPEGTPVWARFMAAIMAATLGGGLLGALTESALIRPLYARPVFQIVLTFGLGIVFTELVRAIYGPAGLIPIQPPAALDTTFPILGARFETYRVFIIVVGAVLMAAILLLLQRTRIGIIIRAGVQDSEMVQALGINIRRIFTLVFALGCAVAALGGITAAPYLGAFPSMGDQFLLSAVIVVVLGGMSSFEGTVIASILVGLTRATAEQISQQYLNTPVLASLSILLIMIVVLLVRPSGLFGREN